MSARMPHLPAESWELFLRDELSAEATGRIEAHLADCAECRAALERKDASFLFRRLRHEPAPDAALDGLWDAISAEIREVPPARLGPPSRPAPSRRVLMGGLGAAAAIIVVGMLVIGRLSTSTSPPPEPVVAVEHAVEQPCPAALTASLKLTREECAALYGAPIASPEAPLVMVSDSLDLRGL